MPISPDLAHLSWESKLVLASLRASMNCPERCQQVLCDTNSVTLSGLEWRLHPISFGLLLAYASQAGLELDWPPTLSPLASYLLGLRAGGTARP